MTDHVALYHAFGADRQARRAATASRLAVAPRHKKPIIGDAAESVANRSSIGGNVPKINRSSRTARRPSEIDDRWRARHRT
ncbi:hypothetical protein [Burkholderia plantarii]|uniref:hypothetical protein n=1 Tax=Burkholderia plantarii TaxID=41899 RepID=UPI0008706E2C|nr:hypothetical protein [Burkholderia plantarii]